VCGADVLIGEQRNDSFESGHAFLVRPGFNQ
jgi:hypothetical protein